MATELTTPIEAADITHQGITRITFNIPHKRDVTGTKAVFNKDAVTVHYEVTTWNEAGEIVSRASRTVPFVGWPAIFKQNTAAVLRNIESDARSNNLIGDGTDEDLGA